MFCKLQQECLDTEFDAVAAVAPDTPVQQLKQQSDYEVFDMLSECYILYESVRFKIKLPIVTFAD